MLVSARADYALRAAIELAAAPGSHVTGEQLARAQDIPGMSIETIMTQLRRSGLVRSQRGPDGGFWLARPASEISLADIIRAVDGQSLSARGEPQENATYPGPAEPLRRVWIALRAFGPTVLATVTLADIVSGELWLPADPQSVTVRIDTLSEQLVSPRFLKCLDGLGRLADQRFGTGAWHAGPFGPAAAVQAGRLGPVRLPGEGMR
jgi:Rrf2 family protein